MTIGVAWIRETGGSPELWIATDSRLSGDGNHWDSGPKTALLPRRDLVAAFAGATQQAYPLLAHAAAAMAAYRPACDGELELFDLLGHVERLFNDVLSDVRLDPSVVGATPARPEFTAGGDTIVFGGFSRQTGGMIIRSLGFNPNSTPRWSLASVRPSRTFSPHIVHVFGDTRSKSRFRYRLKTHLAQTSVGGALGFEPLEALGAFLGLPEAVVPTMAQRTDTVGGSPQVVRVRVGAAATPFVVRWGDRGDYLYGRRCLSYERLDLPLLEIDPTGRVQVVAPGAWSPGRD